VELKVIEKKENPIMSRTEFVLEGVSDGATPSYDSIKKKIAGQFKANEDMVVVKHVYPQFGTVKFKVIVNIYSDKAVMNKVEPENVEKKEEKKPSESSKEKPQEKQKEEEESGGK